MANTSKFGVKAALITALITLMISSACLCGCSLKSDAQKSAEQIPFDSVIANDFQAALDQTLVKADDAKFVAVQSSTFAEPGVPPTWTFLFYSWQRASAYTTFDMNGEIYVADLPGMSLNQVDFDAIPANEAPALDVDAAYQLVCKQLKGKGQFFTCRAYLISYVAGDEDPTADAMKWFFSFNEPDDMRESSVSKTGEVAPATLFAVDVNTGEVTEYPSAAN